MLVFLCFGCIGLWLVLFDYFGCCLNLILVLD